MTMIQTAIIIGERNKILVWYPFEGFAKDEAVAFWIFEYCGWPTHNQYPDLAIVKEEIEFTDCEEVFDCDMTQLWVLGGCLHLN